LTKKDEELARLRLKLEKRWGNDNDGSYAYLDSIMGQRYPFTPFMMDEWVQGMVRSARYKFFLSLTILYSTMEGQLWRHRPLKHVLILQTISSPLSQLTVCHES
jgi:hypothetical protein